MGDKEREMLLRELQKLRDSAKRHEEAESSGDEEEIAWWWSRD